MEMISSDAGGFWCLDDAPQNAPFGGKESQGEEILEAEIVTETLSLPLSPSVLSMSVRVHLCVDPQSYLCHIRLLSHHIKLARAEVVLFTVHVAQVNEFNLSAPR